MKHFSFIFSLGCTLLIFSSCKNESNKTIDNFSKNITNSASSQPDQTVKQQHSTLLVKHFPLLPIIEKKEWNALLRAEAEANNAKNTIKKRTKAAAQAQKIAKKIKNEHPFEIDETNISLGSIELNKKTREIKIPATLTYPEKDREGNTYPIELILCTEQGRIHETLFTTQARPLHLELLLHLNGCKKLAPTIQNPTLFSLSIELPNAQRIPVEELLSTEKNKVLKNRMYWEFSGANYKNTYAPDYAGDMIITQHTQESVLRIKDANIAKGNTLLHAIQHSELEKNMKIKLILTICPLQKMR